MKTYLFFALSLFFLLVSCSPTDDIDIDPDLPVDPFLGLESKTVTVKFPEGTSSDFKDFKLYSSNLESEVGETGEGKVFLMPDAPAFSYLFDDQDNLIMAGLVSPTKAEISIETTTEFLLYHAFSVPFGDEIVATRFFDEVRQFPIWDQALALVKEQFATDSQMIGKAGIGDKLNALINPLLEESKLSSPNARIQAGEQKASDLLIDGTIRESLQAFQTGLNQFSVSNTARRRVHGFLYKTSIVDQAGNEQTLVASPGSSASIVPDKEIPLAMVNGVTGISSTIYEYLTKETQKSFLVTSDPVSIPLTEAEKQANWQLRIVGVGSETNGSRNQAEISKTFRLQMMTLTLDFVVPMIADAIAVKGLVSKGQTGPKGEEFLWEAMITTVAGYVDKMPEVKGKIDKGEYAEAMIDFYQIGYNQFGSIFLEDLAKIAAETIYNALPKDIARPNLEKMKESASRKVKIIGAIDLILKGSDYFRKVYDIQGNKNLGIWEIKAREIEVNLEPQATTVEVKTEKKLTAFIKSTLADGQIIEYHWSTTAKYGFLKDDKGHEGDEFTSSSKEVFYACTAEADPTQPDRKDTVKVEIFMRVGLDRYKIGSDYSILEVGDKEVFTASWEPKVQVTERVSSGGKTEWTITGGAFVAKFAHRTGAVAYDLQNVRNDGTKAGVVRRTPEQLQGDDGQLMYRVGIGSINIYITDSPTKRDERIEVIKKQLDGVKHNYNRLEVTVIR